MNRVFQTIYRKEKGAAASARCAGVTAGFGRGLRRRSGLMLALALSLALPLGVPACAAETEAQSEGAGNARSQVSAAVNFDRTLDEYEPLKDSYNFYFTYKLVHAWWDAVAMGIEDAVAQYEEKGVMITYEYLAPPAVSAEDQKERLLDAAQRGFDVIGVDVADIAYITPVINELIDDGQKVMTFSSSDATAEDGCRRIAYVGNTHNYEDGALLAEALCEKLGCSGKVAILVGDEHVPCHEDRARAARDVIAAYPDMEVVAVEYDHDSIDNAQVLAAEILEEHEDLSGFICCNMSNPVGAARAVIAAGRQEDVTIVGMDHDEEALKYLRDGVIYCLGVQDCYSIGFDTIQTAVKIADGQTPGDLFPELTNEITTIIYREDAEAMLQILYGEKD